MEDSDMEFSDEPNEREEESNGGEEEYNEEEEDVETRERQEDILNQMGQPTDMMLGRGGRRISSRKMTGRQTSGKTRKEKGNTKIAYNLVNKKAGDNSENNVKEMRVVSPKRRRRDNSKRKGQKDKGMMMDTDVDSRKRERPVSGTTPQKNKKTIEGDMFTGVLVPLDETLETATKFIHDDDESVMDFSSSDEEINGQIDSEDQNNGVKKSKMDEHTFDFWLYDRDTGPLQEIIRRGFKVTIIEFKRNLEELVRKIRGWSIQIDNDESVLKIQILESKLVKCEDEFYSKFQKSFSEDWEIYRKLKESKSTINKEMAEVIEYQDFRYFRFLLEMDFDKLIKWSSSGNVNCVYIHYKVRRCLKKLDSDINRNVIKVKDINKIRNNKFLNEERPFYIVKRTATKGSVKRCSIPNRLNRQVSVIAIRSTRESNKLVDTIRKLFENMLENVGVEYEEAEMNEEQNENKEKKKFLIVIEHQNLSRFIVHMEKDVYERLLKEDHMKSKKSNIFLDFFPAKFRHLPDKSNQIAICRSTDFNVFISNCINNYIGVMYRYYGKLETLLEKNNKFIHIRQMFHKERRAISIIPADEETRRRIISRINEDYVEPILPREVFKEAQKILTGLAKIDDICAKEYICKDGCVYYNRGKKQGRCSSRKLHIEDEKLQKALFEICKKGIEIDENIREIITRKPILTGPMYVNKEVIQTSRLDYLGALQRPKRIDTIMLSEENKLLKIENYKGRSSSEVLVELKTIINHDKINNLIQEIELIGEKVRIKESRKFGAIKLKEDSEVLKFKRYWDTYSEWTGQEIKIQPWTSIKHEINNVPSPTRRRNEKLGAVTLDNDRIKMNDSSLKELMTKIHEIDIRSIENSKRFDRFETSFSSKLDTKLDTKFNTLMHTMKNLLKDEK
jgi:hypothetical protein